MKIFNFNGYIRIFLKKRLYLQKKKKHKIIIPCEKTTFTWSVVF